TVPVPQSTAGYNQFSIADSLGSGLEFAGWTSGTVGSTELDPSTDYTEDTDTHTISLTEDGLAKLNAAAANGEVTVTAVISTTVTKLGSHVNKATVSVNGNEK